MKSVQVQVQLLTQHAELRRLIEEARVAIERVPMGQPEDDDGPAACLTRLASALQAHNLSEESLLDALLVTADLWGPVRAHIMDGRHAAEHMELHAALALPTFNREQVGQTLDRLLGHMAYEEQALIV